jgi:glycerol-3-phosphate acyltransferase PlsY
MVALIVSLLIAFLAGSLPTSFLFGKFFAGIDIRKEGSGNVGATNVYRVMGKLPGIITLIIDIAKGACAVSLVASYCYRWGMPLSFLHYQIFMALAVVSGHNWTPWLKFKGGKGMATSMGVLVIICPKILLLTAIVWIAVFAVTRIVSVASIAASIFLPVIAAFFGEISVTSLATMLCVIAILKHRSNIQRLIRGGERRLKL